MKKLILAILIAFPLMAMSQGKSTYKAAYSSNFTMADPSYSDKILTLWKDYEDNTLDMHVDMFSDTVTMMLADGSVVKGKALNLAGVKDFRGSIKDRIMSGEVGRWRKSVDRNENLVCVWGN